MRMIIVLLLFLTVSNALSSCDSYCSETYPGQPFPSTTISPLQYAFQASDQIVFSADVTSSTILLDTITYTLQLRIVFKVLTTKDHVILILLNEVIIFYLC